MGSFGFRVPEFGEPTAGPLAFEVVASSTSGDSQSAAGVLSVEPVRRMSLHLGPPQLDSAGTSRYQVTLHNDGNVEAKASLIATDPAHRLSLSLDPAVIAVAPGERETAVLSVQSPRRQVRDSRTSRLIVSVVVDGREAASATATPSHHAPFLASRTIRLAAIGAGSLVAATISALAIRALIEDSPEAETTQSATADSTGSSAPQPADADIDPACPARGHIDEKGVTGLNPEDIPSLPKDFSFYRVAADRCSPVRWNPCEPIHFVINSEKATPTGVDDVHEAFARIGQATGMTFVYDGPTDEHDRRHHAYLPRRYGERWAPILVRWISQPARGTVQVLGSGFPIQSGDSYVSGVLSLNRVAVSAPGMSLGGGFGNKGGAGAIGPHGVTWGRVILHELTHMLGLGHVKDVSQLMYPEITKHTLRPAQFAAGDAAGLQQIGAGAGCLPVPKLGSPTHF
jgi:hypothetical protein